jgi:hypothetical protein
MTTAFRNNVKPSRPSFPPPVPTAEVPEPDAALPPAQRAQALQIAAAQQYSRWRSAHSPDIEPDVLKANAGAFAGAPVITRQSPAALSAVAADADQAQQRVRDTLNSATVKPEDEARASRVWARAVRLLDSKPSPPEVSAAARDLVANADPADVAVLREELPSYLDSRSAPSDWLDTALAQKIPGAADAVAESKLKAKQLAVVRSNHDRLVHAVKADMEAPYLVDPSTVSAEDYVNPTLG